MPEPALAQEVRDNNELQAIAKTKLVKLLRSYPRDTPFEHILFGYGGVKVTLGDLLDAFNVQR
jgi:hypothetical protein